jgi:hypothetical protein
METSISFPSPNLCKASHKTDYATGGAIMDIHLQDILVMKKPHPCGEKQWQVLRVGADFRLRCLGCGHEVMIPRSKAEKNLRQVFRDGQRIV